MKDEDKTLYVNGIVQEDDKESTVYIGEEQTGEDDNQTIYVGNDENKNTLEAENTVYVGKNCVKDTEIKSEETECLNSEVKSISDNVGAHSIDPINVEKEILYELNDDNDKAEEPNQSEIIQNSDEEIVYYLPTNTMLQKRYRINSVLGEGGFGITYSGWDVTLNIPVAIKEYYPSGLVTRNATLGKTTQVVPVSSAKYGTQFRDGIDRVLDEARRMAKFRNIPGIVGTYDFFEANNTAYIVMEYVDGITLDAYCKENRMDNTTLFNMLVPVMDALQALHNEGIIHRDISPDNIMVDNDGNFKLLDFGAARGYSEESSTTMSVILKKSYAPEEQFRTKGNQGPWTDVYAMGATIYELITGQTPPTSIDRLAEDEIVDIREIAPSLTKGQSDAIMTALAVRQKDRWQSMDEFKLALLKSSGSVVSKSVNETSEKMQNNPKKGFDFSGITNWIRKNRKKCGIIFIALIAVIGILVGINNKNNEGPGYLGVQSSDVPADVKAEYSVGDGTYVTGVLAETPAAKAGFVAGDILIAIDNYELKSEEDFTNIVTRYYAGEKVTIKYLHISKDDEYIEKTKTVKLANKNEQVAFNYTVSSISSGNEESEESNYISADGNLKAHLDSVSHQSSTYFAYIDFTNETDKDVTIMSKDIYLNDIPVDSGGTRKLGVVPANSTLILSSYVSLDTLISKGVDNVESFRIICYFDNNKNDIFNIEENDLSIKIDYTEEDLEEVLSNKGLKENQVENVEEVTNSEDINEENIVASSNTASSDDIVVSLSEIKENSSYTYLYFEIENNSDAEVNLTRDWVYLNDTSIMRATSEGLLELGPHEGTVIEYAFDSTNWKAAKGSAVQKLEVGFIINDDSDPTMFEISNTNTAASVSRLLGFEMDRMKNVTSSKNIEVTLSDIKENSSYTYVTFNVKNISNSPIDLGKSWAYFNGTAICRATSEGSHSLAPGKATVIEYAYDSNYVNAAKGDKISILRLQFYINDADKPEEFYLMN